MKILICVDDTDSIDQGATGELAAMIADKIGSQNWGTTTAITRHQLLLHPDVPYTSHNSSMCFAAEIKDETLDELIAAAIKLVEAESAPGSDPGLCVVVVDSLLEPVRLIDFGKKAKEIVLTKQEAYDLAAALKIHLSEHGGTGQGVIGALAGIGLRLSGNDGRLKGKIKIAAADMVMSVGDIYKQSKIEQVKSLDGVVLADSELVKLEQEMKTVYLEHRCVLLVRPSGAEIPWETCPNSVLKNY